MSLGINCYGKMILSDGGVAKHRHFGGKVFPFDLSYNLNTENVIE
jgi:hypothetical protein